MVCAGGEAERKRYELGAPGVTAHLSYQGFFNFWSSQMMEL